MFSYLQSKNKKIKVYTTVILSGVLDARGTLSLTLKEGHKLRNFESGLTRKVFASTRQEVTGDWIMLCYKELRLSSKFYSGIKIKMNGIT